MIPTWLILVGLVATPVLGLAGAARGHVGEDHRISLLVVAALVIGLLTLLAAWLNVVV